MTKTGIYGILSKEKIISSKLGDINSMGLFNNQIHEETVQNYANITEVLKFRCGGKIHKHLSCAVCSLPL